jgi:hypothetical protein
MHSLQNVYTYADTHNFDRVIANHGERWYRIFHLFLAWSTYIAGTGGATCYQLTCHKNRNSFNRRSLISTRLDAKNCTPMETFKSQ